MQRKRIGEYAAMLRNELGWSSEQMAGHVGLSARLVEQFEDGDLFIESTLQNMCEHYYNALGIDLFMYACTKAEPCDTSSEKFNAARAALVEAWDEQIHDAKQRLLIGG